MRWAASRMLRVGDAAAALAVGGQARRQIQDGERRPRVGVGEARDQGERLLGDLDLEVTQAALAVGQGPLQDGDELILGEAAQDVHAAAREQGRVDLERRILGGGPHEDHRPLLDVGEEGILLGAVEAVDLVHEEDGPGAAAPALGVGRGDDLADLLHPGQHRGERHEVGAGHRGHQRGEGGLPGARRPPQDHRVQLAALDGGAQDPPRTQQVLLPDDLVQGARPHAIGEGGRAPGVTGSSSPRAASCRAGRAPPAARARATSPKRSRRRRGSAGPRLPRLGQARRGAPAARRDARGERRASPASARDPRGWPGRR